MVLRRCCRTLCSVQLLGWRWKYQQFWNRPCLYGCLWIWFEISCLKRIFFSNSLEISNFCFCFKTVILGECSAKNHFFYNNLFEKAFQISIYLGKHEISSCLYPLSKGSGPFEIQRYYYDAKQKACVEFIYTGRGGNGNRFTSKQECLAVCIDRQFNSKLLITHFHAISKTFRNKFCLAFISNKILQKNWKTTVFPVPFDQPLYNTLYRHNLLTEIFNLLVHCWNLRINAVLRKI